MNWIVAVLAVLAAFDVAQRCRQLRDTTSPQRLVTGGGAFLVAIGLAVVATPLLDALDISAPNMQIGAGIVLGVYSIVALVTWDNDPAPRPVYRGVVPLLFPIVLTPAVGVVVLAVAARNGLLAPIIASAIAAAAIAWQGGATFLGRRPVRMLSAAIGVATAVAMIVDGAFAV